MTNTMKRMLSGIMAMAMTCGISTISAFAVEVNNLEEVGDFTATSSEVNLPTIDVTVPTGIEIAINPYNLGNTGQITAADAVKVVNNSEVPVNVTLTKAKAVGSNITIVAKAPAATVTEKQAMINLSYTDGLGKTTSKVLSSTEAGEDIAIATAIAPLGGSISYTFTGSTSVKTAEAWSDSDAITVSNAFKFEANTYATYEIKKTLALYSTDADKTFTAATDAEKAAVIATLPTSILADGKEMPVTWDSTDYASGAGTFTAKLDTTTYENITDIYTVADTLTWPTITVTAEAAESGT